MAGLTTDFHDSRGDLRTRPRGTLRVGDSRLGVAAEGLGDARGPCLDHPELAPVALRDPAGEEAPDPLADLAREQRVPADADPLRPAARLARRTCLFIQRLEHRGLGL